MLNSFKSLITTLLLFAAIAYGSVMKFDQAAILQQINIFLNHFKGKTLKEFPAIDKFLKQSNEDPPSQ